MRNKLILILMIISIAASCITPVMAIEDDVPIPDRLLSVKKASDNSSYENIYELLSYIDVVTDKLEDLKTEKEVTRGIAAEYAARLQGTIAQATEKPYSDVDLSHKNVNGISSAKAYGILDKNEQFYPNRAVTLAEASEWLIKAVGNDLMVLDGDYMSAAKKLGMLDGLLPSGGKKLTLAEFFVLLENTLNSPIAYINIKGKNDITVSLDDTTTYLYKKYKIVLQKGVMTGVGYSSIDKTTAGEGKVKINAQSYEYSTKDLSGLVGKAIWAYTDMSDGENCLITAWENSRLNNIVNIDKNNVSSIDKSQISYYDENNNQKRLKISTSGVVLINGIYYGNAERAYINDIWDEYISIEVIDDDGDKVYDCIKLEQTEDRVLKMVSQQAETIIFKYGAESINLDDDNKIVTIYEGNKIVGIDGLSANNILTIAQAQTWDGTEIINITVSKKSITGVLKGIREDDEKTYYDIDGKIYPLSKSYKKFLAEDNSEQKPRIGMSCTFYLSARGEIAASAFFSGYNYAFMRRVYYDDENEVGYINLYTLEGEFKKYAMAEKVRLITPEMTEGTKLVAEKICMMLSDTNSVIAYRTDTEGTLLTDIVLPMDRTMANKPEGTEYPLTKDYVCGDTTSQKNENWLYTGILGNLYTLKGVQAMVYPKGSEARENEKNYKASPAVFSDYGNDYYFTTEKVTLYNVDEFYVPSFATVEKDEVTSSGVNSFNKPVMIVNVEMGINGDDEVVTYLSYYNNGKIVTRSIPEDADWFNSLTEQEWVGASGGFDTLKVGDIVQFETNISNEIILLRRLFSCENMGEYRVQSGSDTGPTTLSKEKPFARIAIIYGKVSNVKDGYINLNLAGESNISEIIIPNYIATTYESVTYTLFDKKTKKVSIITASDVMPGDTAVVRKRYNTACDIFIYR